MTAAAGAIVNVLVVGTGGQGVMTASEIVAQAAIAGGHDVKKTEVAGMAQRGGVVTSHVRFGPRVLSPSIPSGEADVLIGFEPAEAARWCAELRADDVAIVSTMRLVPPIVSIGMFAYPDDPLKVFHDAGVKLMAIDAGAIAREIGDLRLGNTVMLAAAADSLPFPPGTIKDILVERFRERKPALAELNERAFEAGRAAALAGASQAAGATAPQTASA